MRLKDNVSTLRDPTVPLQLNFLIPSRTRVVLHRFSLIEETIHLEPNYLEYIIDWTKTDQGRWCCENATEISLHTHQDIAAFTINYAITGMLTEKQQTFYRLKFG
jgi:hypothetical protein